MSWVKSIIKSFLSTLYYYYLVIDTFFLKKNKNTIVFDIDNTLADTWPTLIKSKLKNYKDDKERVANLSLIKGAKELIAFSTNNYDQVLFLSARNPLHYKITKKWIKTNFGDIEFKLRLVPKVRLKILYWKRLSLISKKTIVLDDLSYNHENNNIKYYKSEISFLEDNQNIEYFNYMDIKEGLNYIQKKL